MNKKIKKQESNKVLKKLNSQNSIEKEKQNQYQKELIVQIEQRNKNKLLDNKALEIAINQQKELDSKFLNEEKKKTDFKQNLFQQVLDSRKNIINDKNKNDQIQKQRDELIEKQLVEKARKELDEQEKKRNIKKQYEKENLKLIIKQKENSYDQKLEIRKKEKDQETKALKEFDRVQERAENERNLLYQNIKDRVDIQELRLKQTEEYLKLHSERNPNDKTIKQTKFNNEKDEILIENKNSTVNEIIKKLNNNKAKSKVKNTQVIEKESGLIKKEQMQQENNLILKRQIEEKANLKKREELENEEYKKKINEEYNNYKKENKSNEDNNKERLLKYKEELEKQLGSIKSNKVVTNLNYTNNMRLMIKEDKHNLISHAVIEIMDKLYLLGEHSLLKLENVLRLFDVNKHDYIHFKDLSKLLVDFGLVSSNDIKKDELLYKIFTIFVDERNPEEVVGITVLIDTIRGKMSNKRIYFLRKLFNSRLNKAKVKSNNSLLFENLKKQFIPRVIDEALPLSFYSQEELLNDFIEGWNIYIKLTYFPELISKDFWEIDKKIDCSSISENEFLDFYSYVSPFIPEDFIFEALSYSSFLPDLNTPNFLSNTALEFLKQANHKPHALPLVNKPDNVILPQIEDKSRKNYIKNQKTDSDLKSNLNKNAIIQEHTKSLFQKFRYLIYNSQGYIGIIKVKNLALTLISELKSIEEFLFKINKELGLGLNYSEIKDLEKACSENEGNCSLTEQLSNLLKYIVSINTLDKKLSDAIDNLYYSLIHIKSATDIHSETLNLFKKSNALEKMDDDSLPKINLKHLYFNFKPELHPLVLINKKKETDVLKEYHQIFNFHFSFYDKVIILILE